MYESIFILRNWGLIDCGESPLAEVRKFSIFARRDFGNLQFSLRVWRSFKNDI
jgi:hypothetical protein